MIKRTLLHENNKTGLWILSNMRSGSSYLVNIINKSVLNCFDMTEDFCSVDINGIYFDKFSKRKEGIELVIKEIISKEIYPAYTKLLAYNFVDANISNITFLQIIQRYPNLKFIYLVRDDIYAKTVSLYIANETGIWGASNNNLLNKKIPFIKEKVLKYFRQVKKNTYFWNDIIPKISENKIIKINYKDLISNPIGISVRINNFMGNIININNITKNIEEISSIPVTRIETKKYIKKLKKIKIFDKL